MTAPSSINRNQSIQTTHQNLISEIEQVQQQAKCLFNANQVEAAIHRLAIAVTEQLQTKNPIMLCVMNGGLILTGCLLQQLSFPLQVDYVHATRYRGKLQGQEQVQWLVEPQLSLQNRHVVIIDDIVDRGDTMASVVEYCQRAGCAQVWRMVLVARKIAQSSFPMIPIDFIGLTVTSNAYLFGYGLDYKGYLRNAPGIFAINETMR